MKKTIIVPLTLGLLLLIGAGFVYALEPSDFVGTWKGKFYLPDMMEDGYTMVFELKDDKLSGQIKDELGLADNSPLQDITWDDKEFAFVFHLNDGEPIYVKGMIIGKAMAGAWEHPGVDSGTFIGEKQ